MQIDCRPLTIDTLADYEPREHERRILDIPGMRRAVVELVASSTGGALYVDAELVLFAGVVVSPGGGGQFYMFATPAIERHYRAALRMGRRFIPLWCRYLEIDRLFTFVPVCRELPQASKFAHAAGWEQVTLAAIVGWGPDGGAYHIYRWRGPHV